MRKSKRSSARSPQQASRSYPNLNACGCKTFSAYIRTFECGKIKCSVWFRQNVSPVAGPHAFLIPMWGFYMAAYTLRSNLNWVDLPDCAHFMENGKCSALRVDSCEGARCAFYRSREKEAAAQLAVYRRLAACDAATQQRIASRYYGGQLPWLHTIPTGK